LRERDEVLDECPELAAEFLVRKPALIVEHALGA
jgi:hypothetical protein